MLYRCFKFIDFGFEVFHDIFKPVMFSCFRLQHLSNDSLLFKNLSPFLINPAAHCFCLPFQVLHLYLVLPRELLKVIILHEKQRVIAFNHRLQWSTKHRTIASDLWQQGIHQELIQGGQCLQKRLGWRHRRR